MRRFIVPLLIALAAASCGEDQTSPGLPVGTPDPSSVPPSAATSHPKASIPPELLHLRFDAPGEAVTWKHLGNNISYEVEGSATWEAACDLRRSGDRPKEKSFSAGLPAGTARYRLPRPKDDRFTMLKEFQVEVFARRPNGSTITRESIDYIGDGFC